VKGILSIYVTKAYEEVELYRHSFLSSMLDGTGLSVSSLGRCAIGLRAPVVTGKESGCTPHVDYLVRG
jgi:hypothetical protein